MSHAHAAEVAEQGPQEILQDGLDALADHQPDLARQLFEDLVLSYPDTPQAEQALLALSELSRPAATPIASTAASRDDDDTPPTGPDRENRRLAELRDAFVKNVGDRVFFAENSAVIGVRARAMIENQGRWLKTHPGLSVKIIGRANDNISAEESKALSLQRAEAVRGQLIAAGFAAGRIGLEAGADGDLPATCRTSLCQAQNRLAETVLMEPKLASEAGATVPSLGPPLGRLPVQSRSPLLLPSNAAARGAAASEIGPSTTIAR